MKEIMHLFTILEVAILFSNHRKDTGHEPKHEGIMPDLLQNMTSIYSTTNHTHTVATPHCLPINILAEGAQETQYLATLPQP